MLRPPCSDGRGTFEGFRGWCWALLVAECIVEVGRDDRRQLSSVSMAVPVGPRVAARAPLHIY